MRMHLTLRKSLGGIGLVGLWFGVFSIPLVEATTCTQGSEDNWLASLFFYFPLSCLFLVLAWLGVRTPSAIKWLSLPLFVLLPWAAFIAAKYVLGVTLAGHHPCTILTDTPGFDEYPRSGWNPFWGPVQLGYVVVVGWLILRYWRNKAA